MDKTLRKLVAAALALILSAVMVVTMSYAWMTLSTSPIAEGMQITIGGGNTILIAADQTDTINGKVYHYPGAFNPTLNFHQLKEYSYLSQVASLTPVSTADGVHWFVPTHMGGGEKIAMGEGVQGQFALDDKLAFGNLSAENELGGYVYLDFWVVSPGTDYILRLSKGDENGGSYVLELMEPKAVDGNGDGENDAYALITTSGRAASTARIGFLTNDDLVLDDTMLHYQKNPAYRNQYTKLKGVLPSASDSMWYSQTYQFTIYEPNGDLHPDGTNGTYYPTYPLGYDMTNSMAVATDISNRLTVQTTNQFRSSSATGVPMDQLFQTAILGKSFDSEEEVKTAFYHKYLQGQLMPYVNKGDFVQNTAALYSYCRNDDLVDADEWASLNKAGATDDVCIARLEKNVPQRIRMFIWIEGQDPDLGQSMEPVDIALSIELAGSQVDIYGNSTSNYQGKSSKENYQYSGNAIADPFGVSLLVHNRAGAWEGLCNLWQVQLLPGDYGKHGSDYSGWGVDRL